MSKVTRDDAALALVRAIDDLYLALGWWAEGQEEGSDRQKMMHEAQMLVYGLSGTVQWLGRQADVAGMTGVPAAGWKAVMK